MPWKKATLHNDWIWWTIYFNFGIWLINDACICRFHLMSCFCVMQNDECEQQCSSGSSGVLAGTWRFSYAWFWWWSWLLVLIWFGFCFRLTLILCSMAQGEAGGGKNEPPAPPAPPSPALHAGSKVSHLLWRSISRIYTCVDNHCPFIHVNIIVLCLHLRHGFP